MIGAQQKNLGGITFGGLIDINADNAQRQARVMLDRLIAAESG